MKIVKPLRLSVLNRPFRWEGKNYLGVSVIALADMGPSPKLRPEVELWQLAASELQTSGGIIDMAIPKVRAEFLATGHAYTHHQQEKPPARCVLMWRTSVNRWLSSAIATGLAAR